MKTMGNEVIECESVIDFLYDARILNIDKLEDGNFYFREGCDNYFGAELTLGEVKKFIQELEELIK